MTEIIALIDTVNFARLTNISFVTPTTVPWEQIFAKHSRVYVSDIISGELGGTSYSEKGAVGLQIQQYLEAKKANGQLVEISADQAKVLRDSGAFGGKAENGYQKSNAGEFSLLEIYAKLRAAGYKGLVSNFVW